VRTDGDTPPSAEYRVTADETLVLLPPYEPEQATLFESLAPFDSGWHFLTKKDQQNLTKLAERLRQKAPARLEITGFADEQNLTSISKQRYEDNQKLSEARAKETEAFLRAQPGMQSLPITTKGRGNQQSATQCDTTNSHASAKANKTYQNCLAPDRRVEIAVWYPPNAPKGCKGTTAVDSAEPFRVSIDGAPMDPRDGSNSADQTRCVDVALERKDIQVKFDGLEITPTLNVTAYPDGAARGETVTFTPYSNYRAFIQKAELRIFAKGASTQTEPLAIVPLDASADKSTAWKIPIEGQDDALQYLLRVYDKNGRFDETKPKLLRLIAEHHSPLEPQNLKREELIGYGENHLGIHNIDVTGGSVTISGTNLKPGGKVMAMDSDVPVDRDGKFAYRQILPAGDHKIAVTTVDGDGQQEEFHRPITIPSNDWFYVGMGDLTLGQNNVSGPADLVTGQSNDRTKGSFYADSRAAFYAKGKIEDGWQLTTSADTQEQPVKDLFSNFADKNPRYLLRRIDPNAYYPVYGDDSTTLEDAPTQGKFYVRMEKDDTRFTWGNFQTQITGTDLIDYRRTLYGANAEHKSQEVTKFGERRTEINGFAADPGTLSSLEEFRGTGGSLYYLRSQDVTIGSERVRIEVRDRDSGIVLSSKELVYGQDYEINYLQGRIILREPLSSTADGSGVVSSGSLSGNPAFLVAGYEYTPGVTKIDSFVNGGRVSQWINDYLRFGATSYNQDNSAEGQDLKGADVIARYSPETYLKLESAKSEGAGGGALNSQNGGFIFNTIPQTRRSDVNANAYRAETAINLKDLDGAMAGKLTSYYLDRGDGFSSPGQLTNEQMTQSGVAADLPLGERLNFNLKGDQKQGRTTGGVTSGEAAANYRVTPENTLTLAMRSDDREKALSGGNSAILDDVGSRTDAALKLLYAPLTETGRKDTYEVYALGQGTVQHDMGRRRNDRGGAGGKVEVTDDLSLLGEATDGTGGIGGKAGAEYRHSDRTTIYSNYVMDTDRTDLGYRGRSSSFITGTKTRYSDSMSAFSEDRFQNYDNGPSGLIHSYGLDMAASDSWNMGARAERGTISDPTAGDTDRNAVSLNAGYRFEKNRYTGAVELRDDDNNLSGQRTSWLFKNKLGYQTDDDWRLLAGLDYATSDGSTSNLVDANYTEFMTGYGYRPVLNDRLNMLFKYSYLADHPGSGQLNGNRLPSASDYEQRSHVLAVDGIYDITEKFALGGKYGYRFGDIRDNTVANANWFGSQAWLGIIRGDYHIVKEWDIVTEYRYLDAKEAGDSKSGFLVGVYRHLNDHLKIGIGYNFTNFSDDLTDLSYRSQGSFVNFTSKF